MSQEYSVRSELDADEWDAEFSRKQSEVVKLRKQNVEMAELLRLMAWKNENGYTKTDVQHWLDTATRLLADLESK